MARGLLENVVKVTKLEVVKIEFRHLPFLLSFFLSSPASLSLAPKREQCPGQNAHE